MPPRIQFEKTPSIVILAVIGLIAVFLSGIGWLVGVGVFRAPLAVSIKTIPALSVSSIPFKGSLWELKKSVEQIWRENPDSPIMIKHSISPLKMRMISVECWYGIAVDSKRWPRTVISQLAVQEIKARPMVCITFKERGVYMGVRARKIAQDYLGRMLQNKHHLEENERYEVWEKAKLNTGMEICFPLKDE